MAALVPPALNALVPPTQTHPTGGPDSSPPTDAAQNHPTGGPDSSPPTDAAQNLGSSRANYVVYSSTPQTIDAERGARRPHFGVAPASHISAWRPPARTGSHNVQQNSDKMPGGV
ncbi:hypothetical protein [Corynebacterium auriscanis]|uniref:hypothetical protein n=1 Tax=Corynebacterium auriscanis TaxID=99807 RepID=UPI003CF3AC5D